MNRRGFFRAVLAAAAAPMAAPALLEALAKPKATAPLFYTGMDKLDFSKLDYVKVTHTSSTTTHLVPMTFAGEGGTGSWHPYSIHWNQQPTVKET